MAFGMFNQGAFFADGDVASMTEEAQDLLAMFGAHDWLLNLVLLLVVLEFSQRDDSVAIEMLHVLVSPLAVLTQEVGTIKAAGNSKQMFALASSAAQSGTIQDRSLEDIVNSKIWGKSSNSG